MRLLADENVDAAIVQYLRSDGCDVLSAAESLAGESDGVVLELARQQDRILLTNDLDFGELVFRQRLVTTGIILLRFRAAAQSERLEAFRSHWGIVKPDAAGHYTVLRDNKIRRRHLPT